MQVISMADIIVDLIASRTGTFADADQYTRCLGGAGANVTIGLQEHGIKTHLASSVGKGQLGDWVLDQLNAFGVNPGHVITDDTYPTRCCFIVYDSDGNRTVEVANRNCASAYPALVDIPGAKSCDWLYVSGVLLTQDQAGLQAVRNVEWANHNNIKVAFDPVIRLDKAKKPVVERLMQILAHVDLLKVNQQEYAALEAVLKDTTLLDRISVILETRGAEDAIVRAGNKKVLVPANNVNCLDPTGAGDAFLAGFLGAMCNHGLSWERMDAVDKDTWSLWGQHAARSAGRVIQHVGAVTAYRVQ